MALKFQEKVSFLNFFSLRISYSLSIILFLDKITGIIPYTTFLKNIIMVINFGIELHKEEKSHHMLSLREKSLLPFWYTSSQAFPVHK